MRGGSGDCLAETVNVSVYSVCPARSTVQSTHSPGSVWRRSRQIEPGVTEHWEHFLGLHQHSLSLGPFAPGYRLPPLLVRDRECFFVVAFNLFRYQFPQGSDCWVGKGVRYH
jgi:hypothetical protein